MNRYIYIYIYTYIYIYPFISIATVYNLPEKDRSIKRWCAYLYVWLFGRLSWSLDMSLCISPPSLLLLHWCMGGLLTPWSRDCLTSCLSTYVSLSICAFAYVTSMTFHFCVDKFALPRYDWLRQLHPFQPRMLTAAVKQSVETAYPKPSNRYCLPGTQAFRAVQKCNAVAPQESAPYQLTESLYPLALGRAPRAGWSWQLYSNARQEKWLKRDLLRTPCSLRFCCSISGICLFPNSFRFIGPNSNYCFLSTGLGY